MGGQDSGDEPKDAQGPELVAYVKEHGIEDAIVTYTGLSRNDGLTAELAQAYSTS
ncbi:hypothetical protein [Olsenella massiliensis]|uniref:hypothetical protein n=1 Tax=Olsenella massiliensis TaxID=1622075 RepID=UPI000B144225|nr:hypothetical protein [Olsenella massiliensis]